MFEVFRISLSALFHFLLLILNVYLCQTTSAPLNCSDTTRLCTSFLAFKAGPNITLPLVQSMFDVFPEDVTVDGTSSPGYLFIRKNCSCLHDMKYFANTTFTMRGLEGLVYPTISKAYGGLAIIVNSTRKVRLGAVILLHLFCGCSSGLWNYLMSYVMEEGDSVELLSSRFGVSMDDIETVNGMNIPNDVVFSDVYYIPLNSVPGKPYLSDMDISPSTHLAPAPTIFNASGNNANHFIKFPYFWVIGSMGVAAFLIGCAVLLRIMFKSFNFQFPNIHRQHSDQSISHKFQILKSSSFCYASRRFLCFKFENIKHSTKDAGDRHLNIPSGSTCHHYSC